MRHAIYPFSAVTSDSDARALAGSVLVVDDHQAARDSMALALTEAGHRVTTCGSASEALVRLASDGFDVVLSDLRMPGLTGLDLVKRMHAQRIDTQLVMVTAHASVDTAVEAMRHGAFDYLEKPVAPDQLEGVVARALAQARADNCPTKLPPTDEKRRGVAMVGHSPAMRELRRQIEQIAPTDETVLITGESGVGKELVARGIHARSRRASRALISLNCPALAANLMESELFGHERGAFTSADQRRVGRFELADGGTLFLDEITEIELPLQAKLLRVLQERTFERIGSSETRSVDVRLIATTNRDLWRAVAESAFREDLYFRLAVLPIEVPSLRARPDDIPLLAEHFLASAAERLGRGACRLSDSAVNLLCEYHWPGNIRELENVMTRASVLVGMTRLTAEDLRPWLTPWGEDPAAAADATSASAAPHASDRKRTLQDVEREMIISTLEHFDGHRQKTADALGIGVRTLSSKLRSYGLAPHAKTFVKSA